MIEGKKNTALWFESKGYPYWVLFHQGKTDSGNWVAKSNQAEGATVKTALQDLEAQLQYLAHGKYTLVAVEKLPMTGKGNFKEDISISYAEGNSTAPAVNGFGGGVPDDYVKKSDVDNMIASALKQERIEREHQQLKEELAIVKRERAEFEKEASDPMNNFIGALTPFVPHIMNHYMPALGNIPTPAAVQQSQPTIQTEMPIDQNPNVRDLQPEEEERLATVVATLQSVTPEWLDLLEKLAAKAKADPGKIGIFKVLL